MPQKVETYLRYLQTSDARRKWVVAALIAAKVPESIARLALELAVQVFKSKVAKATPASVQGM